MSTHTYDKEQHTFYADLVDFKQLHFSSLTHSSSSFLKLFHANIRSINKNHDLLLLLLSSLNIKFEIIVLSELWIYNLQAYELLLPGYQFHYNINTENHSSGIGIYILNNIKHTVISDEIIDGCEYLRLHIISPEPKYSLRMHCIYRHPGELQKNFLVNL